MAAVLDLVPHAEQLLGQLWGESTSLKLIASRRPNVGRFTVVGTDRSVFLKQPPPRGTDGWDRNSALPGSPAERFFAEWTSLELLRSSGRVPEILVADPDTGLFIMEDLPGQTMDAILLGTDAAAAERMLIDFGRTLGQVQASTVGQGDVFRRRFSERCRVPVPNPVDWLVPYWKTLPQAMNDLGVAGSLLAMAQVEEMIAHIANPGPFAVLTHQDPCPDNAIVQPSGIRIVDFEKACWAHALLDGTYVRMSWTTCWCANRVPDFIVQRVETAYRQALIEGIPQAADEGTWQEAVAVAAVYHALLTLKFHLDRAQDEDPTWGISTLRPRILTRLDAAIIAARQHGWNELADWLHALHQIFVEQWPNADGLPVFPAFRETE